MRRIPKHSILYSIVIKNSLLCSDCTIVMNEISKLLIGLICFFTMVLLTSICYAQSNYAIIGHGSDIEMVFRFEVSDSDSRWPIENARIVLKGHPSNQDIASIYTNHQGIAVLLVKGKVGHISDLESVEVTSAGYRYVEKEVYQWDLLQQYKGTHVHIPTSNWKMTDSMVIEALFSGNYKPYEGSFITSENMVSVGYYFIAMSFSLEKTARKIDVE